jgi:CubicO group peptidase (beta-lactamase class C family)
MLFRTAQRLVALSLLAAGFAGPGCAETPAPAPVAPPAPSPPPETAAAPPTAAPAPAKPPPERLSADTPGATLSGATFTAPAGWSIGADGSLVVLETPEPGSHLALFDAPNGSAEAAVAAAWAAYQSGFERPLKLASPRPGRKGWEERRVLDYETSPNERRFVRAVAGRRGEAWTVILIDFAEPTLEKRAAATRLVLDSIRPKGYTRESFAGRKAHPLDRERIRKITAFVEAAQKTLGVPGVGLALIDGGKVVYEGGLGVRELGKPAKVDEDTLFLAASNTKGLTTLLLAKLVDQGQLAWDTPVAKVYPGFKLGDADTTAKVQIQHLVCACTGLPRQDMEWLFEYGKMTPKGGMDLLGTMQPTSKLGEVYQYSNVLAAAGGWVAAHVVHPDRELGAAYDAAMKELVFDPLGMKGATFDMARAEKGDHASPHSWDIDDRPSRSVVAPNQSEIPFRPAGGAWVSAHDMARYVALELSKGLLPNGERYISEGALLARREKQVAMGEDEIYGMGLRVDTGWGTPFVHHGGADFGYRSDWIAFPEHGAGAVLLTNSDAGTAMLRPFQRKLAEVLFDGHPEAEEDLAARAGAHAAEMKKERERLVVPADPALAAKLAPRYQSPELGSLEVKHQGASTVFDVGEYAYAVASRKNDDGTISFVSADTGLLGLEFVVGERSGKRVLIVRDAQHEYVFTES